MFFQLLSKSTTINEINLAAKLDYSKKLRSLEIFTDRIHIECFIQYQMF